MTVPDLASSPDGAPARGDVVVVEISHEDGTLIVRPGALFLLGDNRSPVSVSLTGTVTATSL